MFQYKLWLKLFVFVSCLAFAKIPFPQFIPDTRYHTDTSSNLQQLPPVYLGIVTLHSTKH